MKRSGMLIASIQNQGFWSHRVQGQTQLVKVIFRDALKEIIITIKNALISSFRPDLGSRKAHVQSSVMSRLVSFSGLI